MRESQKVRVRARVSATTRPQCVQPCRCAGSSRSGGGGGGGGTEDDDGEEEEEEEDEDEDEDDGEDAGEGDISRVAVGHRRSAAARRPGVAVVASVTTGVLVAETCAPTWPPCPLGCCARRAASPNEGLLSLAVGLLRPEGLLCLPWGCFVGWPARCWATTGGFSRTTISRAMRGHA